MDLARDIPPKATTAARTLKATKAGMTPKAGKCAAAKPTTRWCDPIV